MTPSSTSCSRGDVFLARVRFSDGSGGKRRPVVIVSVDEVHRDRSDALVVPLTTNLATTRFGDHLLADWSLAGLPRPSVAKGVVETVARSTLAVRLGQLSARDMAGIDRALRRVLGL